MANAGQTISSMGQGAASGAAVGTALGPGLGTAIGAGVGAGVGLLGSALSGDNGDEQYAQALALQQQMQKEINAIPLPPIEAQKIVLERYRSAGVLTPEAEALITQGPSQMAQIKTDPRLQQAQMGALAKLQQVGAEGLNATDRMALDELSRTTAQQQQARQQSILQGMQQRGVAGGGAELAAQLSSSQAGAEAQQQQGRGIAAQAQQRALNAIMQGGQLGGQMQAQSFGEQAQQAQAADAIARFNAANRQNVEGTNVAGRNQAQQMNLANQQSIMNANTQVANQQEQYNKQLAMQNYYAQLAKYGLGQKAAASTAGSLEAAGKRADSQQAGVMGGFGTIAASAPGIANGLQGPAQYNTKTGEALYNPQTGVQYGSEPQEETMNISGASKSVSN